MRCDRCLGFIVPMHFHQEHTWEYDGWLCLNCGNVIDPLIASNRECQAAGLVGPMTNKGMRVPRGEVASSRLRVSR